VDLIVLISMVFCAAYSVKVVAGIVKSGETSPAMLWPMWFVYSFMLLGFALGAIRGIQQLILHIRNFTADNKSTMEMTREAASEEVNGGRSEERGNV